MQILSVKYFIKVHNFFRTVLESSIFNETFFSVYLVATVNVKSHFLRFTFIIRNFVNPRDNFFVTLHLTKVVFASILYSCYWPYFVYCYSLSFHVLIRNNFGSLAAISQRSR